MRKHTQTTPDSNPRAQMAAYFGTIVDTLEWNDEAWRALCARLLSSGRSVGDLTLRQIHDGIRETREGDHAPSVFPQHSPHPPQPVFEHEQSDSTSHHPDRPEAPRARVSVEITMRVSEDSITLSGLFDMGGLMVRSTRGWRRIPDGWTLTAGPIFFRDHEDLLGHELAEYLGNLPLPLTLADALQEPRGGDDGEADEV